MSDITHIKEDKFSRRRTLRRFFTFSASATAALLFYPLLKYTRFKPKPKPRYVSIKAPLPLSGYHSERDFILFGNENSAHAVSRTCTHLGCKIQYLEDKEFIECPCHQSRFTDKGKRMSGPAERDLKTYAVEIRRTPDGTPTEYVVELV